MNPKMSKKQKELSLLERTINDLSKCRIDRNLSNDNNFASLAVENAVFNLKRVKDLVEGVL